MFRLITILFACLAASACAVIEMPQASDNDDWVDQRLAEDEMDRTAPETIPQTRMSRALTTELDQSAQTVMERRDELIDEEMQAIPADETTTEDFIESGIARTTPPD